MINLIIGLLVICFLLAYWKRLNNQNAKLRFEAELFQLRDKLRWLVIEKKLNSDSPLFELYDKTFSYSIRDSYYFTIFFLNFVGTKRKRNSEDFKKFKKKIKFLSLDIPELNEIKNDYNKALKVYLIQQHIVSFWIITTCLYPISFIKKKVNKVKEGVNQSFFLISKSTDENLGIIYRLNP